MTLHKGQIFERIIKAFEEVGYTIYTKLFNAADYGVPQRRERVIIVGIRNDLNDIMEYSFPKETNKNNWVPLSVAVPELAIEQEKYYFSEKAVQGMKNAKNNMKRGLYQDLNKPCLTVTSHLAKVSLNSRDPVLLVDPNKELYRRFTPLEAARIQSFPDEFEFAGSETDAYRQIGNAIPPVMFWHISNSIKKYLEMVETAGTKRSRFEKRRIMSRGRDAIDTITGYYYQFDYYILQLLNLTKDTDTVIIEGVEDVDISEDGIQKAVQCKYYAKTEYNHSIIASPIRLS